jgi:release factor glutamine methyltransferase
VTIAQALVRGREMLADDGGRDAELLLRAATCWDRTFVLMHPEAELNAGAVTRYEQSLVRRATGEPVQYITGAQEFWGLAMKVTPAVLIPRPETEHLIEAVLARVSRDAALQIVDVGTGSGAIALALASELPKATILATDISEAALEVAQENAAQHSVNEQINFVLCNLLPAEIENAFDVVASNPPYIADRERESLAREVRDFEPAGALFSGTTGFEVYDRLIPVARRVLKPGGWLVMEMGAGQSQHMQAILAEWDEVSTMADLQGISRVVCARKR